MTAKWGKTSIGCFILSLVATTMLTVILQEPDDGCLVCQGECMEDHFIDDNLMVPAILFPMFMFFLSPLNLLGVALAFLGIRKKETPKIYARLGSILNAAWLLIPTLFFVALLIHNRV